MAAGDGAPGFRAVSTDRGSRGLPFSRLIRTLGSDSPEDTKGHLANFKLPKRVFFVDELPRNAMGKVQKNLLRERFDKTFRT